MAAQLSARRSPSPQEAGGASCALSPAAGEQWAGSSALLLPVTVRLSRLTTQREFDVILEQNQQLNFCGWRKLRLNHRKSAENPG